MSAITGARVPLGRTGRKLVLVLHVLTSVGWFGVAVSVAFLVVAAATTGDPAMARSYSQAVATSVIKPFGRIRVPRHDVPSRG